MASGSSIIANISSNLSNTYSYLASLYPKDGVTFENITAARNDKTNYLTLNQPFATYLQNNFGNIDKDGDGVIGADEMDKMIGTMATAGVTKNDLTQLAMTGAYSQETVSQILENFDEMDTNKDGRVTPQEIAAFSFSCNKQEKLDEQMHNMATKTSLFYGNEDASDPASYSILSYRYSNYNKK